MIYLFLKLFLFLRIGFSQESDQCFKANDLTRVVVAGGSITEIIYFLNLDEHLIAVDVTSNYPPNAKDLPSLGYVRNLSTEGILSLDPTLILGENDIGPPIVIEQLRSTEIDFRIIAEEHSAKGILEKLYCIGDIFDLQTKEIKKMTADLNKNVTQLSQIIDSGTLKSTNVMFVLNFRGNSPIVAGKGTSGDGFISMIGCKNAFNEIEGWKAISEESVLNVNPDYIIMPNKSIHRGSGIETIKNNPIIMNTTAGKNENFIFKDAMAMIGFGPRTIKIAIEIAELISEQNQ